MSTSLKRNASIDWTNFASEMTDINGIDKNAREHFAQTEKKSDKSHRWPFRVFYVENINANVKAKSFLLRLLQVDQGCITHSRLRPIVKVIIIKTVLGD